MERETEELWVCGSLPRLSAGRLVDERLLWTTGTGSQSWECISGVFFLLGLRGGVPLGEVAGARRAALKIAGGGDVTAGCVGRRVSFRVVGSGLWTLSAWRADDFRGGGLIGGARAFF